MAKKRKSDGKKSKPRKAEPLPLENLPDPRVAEGVMYQLLGNITGADRDTPLAQAQDLIYQAYDEPREKKRLALAQKALEICPDCADAYVLLAEHAPTRRQALRSYEQAVTAGERALGKEMFEQNAGHFWGILETRPYMRARLGLAHALWTGGRRDGAIDHLKDMLRLNPNDNQGVRYTLAGFLISQDRDQELEELLARYPEEGSAAWAYTRALLAFRQHGNTPAARKLLQQARKTNKHVPDYLLGRKFPPMEQPDFYSPGQESEALEYIGSFLAAWKNTLGAIDWLHEVEGESKKAKSKRPEPKGPLPLIKNWLQHNLAQEFDVWQIDFRRLPAPVRVGDDIIRPWAILVISDSNDLILAHDMVEEEPSPKLLWDVLARAMQQPMAGEPHRPSEVQVDSREVWDALRPDLKDIDVTLEQVEELEHMEAIFQSLTEHLGGTPIPSMLDVPGVTPELVGRFFEAAADFYRQAPWRKVGYESAIKVECDKFESGPWYAVLMGQSGLSFGVALYEDLRLLRKLWQGTLSDEENARRTVATTVTFGSEIEMAAADVEAREKFGWKLERSDAWPSVFRKERGMSMRPPLAWELDLMTAVLHTLPDFVNRRHQDDPTPETVTVPGASGDDVKLTMAWLPEE